MLNVTSQDIEIFLCIDKVHDGFHRQNARMTDAQHVSTTTEFAFDEREARYRLFQREFITSEECATLVALIENYGTIGDGYHGDPHPHTPNETFGGYSFGSTPDTLVPGHMEALRIMMRTRNLLRSHFKVPFLWMDFGHLVFRHATGTDDAEKEEYSHPWHFDNQSEGVKYRTHTAILYLNEEFDGGLTLFREADFGPFREVQPQPGTLLAFDATQNAHAVSKLEGGKRYVLNMWFSTNWRILRRHRRIFKPL